MRIKSIYINGLHNAVNKTYEFGDIVYIFGNNGVGKSTILHAIQLALLGYIPGTAKNSKEALLRHSPIGKIDITITLLSDNGHEISIQRNINKNGNFKIITPDNPNYEDELAAVIKELELPIFNFNDFVNQTANKLKDYFIKNILPTADGQLDWPAILSGAISELNFQDRDAIVSKGLDVLGSLNGCALDQVVAANTRFKDEQSFNKSELQRLQNTIDSLIYYDDYIGPTDINDLTSQILAISALRDQMIKYEAGVSATRTLDTDILTLTQRIDDLGGELAYDTAVAKLPELTRQISELSVVISDKRGQLDSLAAEDRANTAVIQGNGICPYTKTACIEISAKIPELQDKSAEIAKRTMELSAELNTLNQELYTLNSKIQEYDTLIKNVKNIRDHILTLEGMRKDAPAKPDTDKTVFELDQELSTLTESKEKLLANIRYNDTIETITKMKYDAEIYGNALAAWVKKTDTNGLQTDLMVKPFSELADTMTQYIQQMYDRTDITAHFYISSKANSFSFGMVREGVYIPYDLLSSGEKCLYNLALMICIVNNSTSPLKVLLCDDMFDHLDQNAIESTFATLKNINGIQFIFAGVKECAAANDIIITPK